MAAETAMIGTTATTGKMTTVGGIVMNVMTVAGMEAQETTMTETTEKATGRITSTTTTGDHRIETGEDPAVLEIQTGKIASETPTEKMLPLVVISGRILTRRATMTARWDRLSIQSKVELSREYSNSTTTRR